MQATEVIQLMQR